MKLILTTLAISIILYTVIKLRRRKYYRELYERNREGFDRVRNHVNKSGSKSSKSVKALKELGRAIGKL